MESILAQFRQRFVTLASRRLQLDTPCKSALNQADADERRPKMKPELSENRKPSCSHWPALNHLPTTRARVTPESVQSRIFLTVCHAAFHREKGANSIPYPLEISQRVGGISIEAGKRKTKFTRMTLLFRLLSLFKLNDVHFSLVLNCNNKRGSREISNDDTT